MRCAVSRGTLPYYRIATCSSPGSAIGHARTHTHSRDSMFDTRAACEPWDFHKGGIYSLTQLEQANTFLREYGFVVVKDVMSKENNLQALDALVQDLHEVNPTTCNITRLASFREEDLPTSPNHTFRTTCNMAFGRFAWYVRGHENIRSIFASLHGVLKESLACSWDNPFYTPSSTDEGMTERATQLHWDHNWYYSGKESPVAEDFCAQGVYYATGTTFTTPAFVCVPSSHKIWRVICESDQNPSKQGANVLNYLPISDFDPEDIAALGLRAPVRVHVPARSLLLWDSRTCHGNAPAVSRALHAAESGRVAFAICYGPVGQRTPGVHKQGLLKGVAGIRTTHHPGIMLAHDKHGYPEGFVGKSEPNVHLRDIHIPLNAAIDESEFQAMIARAALSDKDKVLLSGSVRLDNVQKRLFNSYWKLDGLTPGDCYEKMLELDVRDLRTLLHPVASKAQGLHPIEMSH